MQVYQVVFNGKLPGAAAIVLSALSIFALILPAPPVFASDFEEGCKQYSAKDYRGAKGSFEKVVAAFPRFALGHYYLGNVLLSSGQVAKAKVAYQNCLSCNPDAVTKKRCEEVLAKLGGASSSGTSSATAGASSPGTVTTAAPPTGIGDIAVPSQTDGESASEAKKKAFMDKAEKEIKAFRVEWQRKLDAGELHGYSARGLVVKPDGSAVYEYPTVVQEMADRDCEEQCKQMRSAAEHQCKFIK